MKVFAVIHDQGQFEVPALPRGSSIKDLVENRSIGLPCLPALSDDHRRIWLVHQKGEIFHGITLFGQFMSGWCVHES